MRGRAQNIVNNSDPTSYPQHTPLPTKPPVFPTRILRMFLFDYFVLTSHFRTDIRQPVRNDEVMRYINIRPYKPSG
jgi:hypothetical protein